MELLRQQLVDLEMKELLIRFKNWQYAGIAVLLAVTFLLHMGLIMRPEEPLFDEVHYVNDARYALTHGGTERVEHPPLGKLIVIGGITFFGDNPVGWRFFAILMGTGSVLIFYLICRRLNLSGRISYLATFLLAFENLTFVQGQITMLDVYSQFFLLLSFWLYLRGNYAFSAVSVAFSALAKLNGALAILVIGLHWLLNRFPRPKRFVPAMMLVPAAFLLLLPVLEYPYWGEFLNPVTRTLEMARLTGSITFGAYDPGGIASRPWEWVLTPEVFAYWWTPRFLGMISPTVWALIIPSMVYVTYRCLKGDTRTLFPFAWFVGLYLIWIPASLITNRASFIFYFYPAVGSVILAISIMVGKLIEVAENSVRSFKRTFLKIIIPTYLLGHIIAFIILAPTSMWWSIPLGLATFIFSFFYLDLTPSPYPAEAPFLVYSSEPAAEEMA